MAIAIAHLNRRSPEPDCRVRRRGTPVGDWVKPAPPGGCGNPAHRISGAANLSFAATGTVGTWPACGVVGGTRGTCGATSAVTGWSVALYTRSTSGRPRRGSGPSPVSRERRAASAMAANAWRLSFWSLWFPGLRPCTIPSEGILSGVRGTASGLDRLPKIAHDGPSGAPHPSGLTWNIGSRL